ncbi:MAG: hypothetical protein QOG00_2089 [Pyrinomonadaceae bacterium]|nr:hypothetical protein [Pyrinomonadaceae bacterium]
MTETAVTSLILRFRDLVTSKGGTILNHATISRKDGYVWWGWWHKPDELIPDAVFRDIKRKANSDGLNILLLDSGRKLLFQAYCTDIQYKIDHTEITSPEPGKTPAYYNASQYRVWFKFERINTDPVPDSELHNFTYVRVNEFFENNESSFTPFYGKQVRSAEELRQQDRTIWFVRPFSQGDLTHEISLLDSYFLKPSHFPQEYTQVQSAKLLWVSDLHFSINGHHNYPDEPNATAQPLDIRITEALKRHNINDLAGIIVSGDITYRAAEEEFDQALQFLQNITRIWNIKQYNIAIVPGNHDVRFSDNPAEKGGTIDIAPSQAREQYAKFYDSLFHIAPNDTMSCGRRFLLKGGVAVDIACLNSQILDQAQNIFQGQGFIGEAQLQEVARGMGWHSINTTEAEDARPFRIAVVHHHIVPVTYRESPKANAQYSVLLDAEALARWVTKYRVSLVIHGHMHQPFLTHITRTENLLDSETAHTFCVSGMGSTGIKLEDVGEINSNTFGIIDFTVNNQVTIQFFSVDPINESRPLTRPMKVKY